LCNIFHSSKLPTGHPPVILLTRLSFFAVMKAILVDVYRHGDKVVLWLKGLDGRDFRLEREFRMSIYLEHSKLALDYLEKHRIRVKETCKSTYLGHRKKVYEIRLKSLSKYERIVRDIERKTRNRLMLYNADIPPEQMFIYMHRLHPFELVDIERMEGLGFLHQAEIRKMFLTVVPGADIRTDPDCRLESVKLGETFIGGEDEAALLKAFAEAFEKEDPDCIIMEDAFLMIPYLYNRLKKHGISCRLHRWDDKPLKNKGGKSFFSYGRVIYRDYAVRLNGRFLVDMGSFMGAECDIEGMLEMSQLCGTRLQQMASKSFGAVFQSALVYELVKRDCLVPYKEKPVDIPISMRTLLKFDRVGQTLDSRTGLHKDVAEIDFSSLFPWIIYNHNISPETLLSGKPPYQEVPGLPLRISLAKKGIVPLAIKPLLDRRMHYKRNPSTINKLRSQGLKWVLVTSFGYLRFREFKLGIASSHMAIGAFAREMLLKAKAICEEHGFEIVHGIVDALYIKKKGISEEEVREICREIELETGVSMSFEGLFKWIVFLPSINDDKRPVPTRYYGVKRSGEVKIRGIEARQHGVPKIVRIFQSGALEIMSKCDSKEDILKNFLYLCQYLRKTLFLLPTLPVEKLACFIRVSKTDYKHDIPQKRAVDILKGKGVKVMPGQKVYFIYGRRGICLPEDYDGRPDMEQYQQLLVRALFAILQPFGFKREEIMQLAGKERQSKLIEYEIVEKIQI